jgi:hypothetical protein
MSNLQQDKTSPQAAIKHQPFSRNAHTCNGKNGRSLHMTDRSIVFSGIPGSLPGPVPSFFRSFGGFHDGASSSGMDISPEILFQPEGKVNLEGEPKIADRDS